MNLEFIKKNYHITTFILLYFSIILGFILGENTTLGPKYDFFYALKQLNFFEQDFKFTFFNYDKIEFPTRISPVFILIIFTLKKIFIDLDLVRFILLNIILLNQILFYQSLKLIFYKKIGIDKKILFLLSCVIFLSPSFRANAIWPESAMLGLLFFNISLYFFLRFNENRDRLLFLGLNIFFLAIAAYIRPSFAVFSIFFLFYITFYIKNFRNIIFTIFLNLIFATPAFYYLFILKIFFISSGVEGNELDFNYLAKIPVILSIIIFHAIPILYFKNFFLSNVLRKENFFTIFFSVIIALILIINFNYRIDFTGGGFFLHLSNFLFKSDYLFLALIVFFVFFSLQLIKSDYKQNLLLFIILILMVPQFSVYHKYYDPLLIILFFTMFNLEINEDYFLKNNLIFLYMFNFIYFMLTFVNSYYIKF
tara:strand:+ start:1016 stop:2284 length:1269 start_codon:yes stop_codon:yes gene_type:complete